MPAFHDSCMTPMWFPLNLPMLALMIRHVRRFCLFSFVEYSRQVLRKALSLRYRINSLELRKMPVIETTQPNEQTALVDTVVLHYHHHYHRRQPTQDYSVSPSSSSTLRHVEPRPTYSSLPLLDEEPDVYDDGCCYISRQTWQIIVGVILVLAIIFVIVAILYLQAW